MDKVREMLLQETNYRCGYCMRNITPRVYYLDDDPSKQPIHDYVFYNIFDRSHIVPNKDVQDDYKDFYNLIALCKICHHEVDKAKMLNTEELKKLKLHWLIASGQFTRLEIDLLMSFYRFLDNRGREIFYTIRRRDETTPFYIEQVMCNKMLFYNIIQTGMVVFKGSYSRGKANMVGLIKDTGGAVSEISAEHDLINLFITQQGLEFCKKFDVDLATK